MARPVTEFMEIALDTALLALALETTALIDIIKSTIENYIHIPFVVYERWK
ncbi:Uncharacterised protein [uncultured archaeon]|nr:Uncharacterised protein [uncultured archaeon]